MNLAVWDETISVKIPHIDEQHKSLINWINSLNEALENDSGEKQVAFVLQKLIDYVSEHFTQEEQLMLACEFPGLKQHQVEHHYFSNRLFEIQKDFLSGEDIGKTTYNFLIDWLICHIKGTDQKYSIHIIEQKKKKNEQDELKNQEEDLARLAKIEAIRKQLAEGSYIISGKDVAGKILEVIKG